MDSFNYTIFESIIENNTSGILLENSQRIILKCNQTFLDMFDIPGYPKDLEGLDCKLLGDNLNSLSINPQEFSKDLVNILINQTKIINQTVYLKNGKVFHRDYVPIIIAGNYQGHFWAYRDISKQTRIYNLALETIKDKTYILSKLGHEIKNHLNCIIGLSDYMIKTHNYQDLELIKQSGHCILDIANALLLNNKHPDEKINMYKIIKEILDILKSTCKNTVKLQIQCDLDNPFYITKKIHIQQILTNLISNAIKYTNEGTVTVYASKTPNNLMQIQIIDTGIGIPITQLETIFKPFTQLDENIPGIGLGLHLVKDLLLQINGSIDVTSQLGKGSEFTITF